MRRRVFPCRCSSRSRSGRTAPVSSKKPISSRCWTPSASARTCRSAAFSRTTATAILRPTWMRSAPLSEGAQRRTLHFAQLAAQHGMAVPDGQLRRDADIHESCGHPARHYRASPRHVCADGRLAGPCHRHAGSLRGHRARHGHQPPTAERTILDVGAKGLTMQSRTEGICATPGQGHALRPAGDAHCKGL